MLKGRDVIHLPVVHPATGKTLGRVTDLMVDTQEGRVTGLLLEAEGEKANRRLDWAQATYDQDVIRTDAEPAPHDPAHPALASSESPNPAPGLEEPAHLEQAPHDTDVHPASPGEASPAAADFLSLSRCEGHPVRTQAGRPLGQVGDLLFDPAQGQLTALEVSDGLMQDLLTGRLQLPWPDVTEWRTDSVIVADHWQDAWQRERE
ncbi:hypothetical protein GTO89_15160 [Heliobacterium gestii]|uniref:PRC-barrel domain-containing protein n=1 Tax=Heliomicrobium gestii TaxID=2699 RepID=A0A845LH85_HELGE|nr:PRC-barrel domain-containing protein [Heliomicrobium gestii]MBM7868101.1 uncharacterized protein YrrD [Heliomicrobium gestii]MZP44370.1 hypothetical protein [Heliomicrobium gestii]